MKGFRYGDGIQCRGLIRLPVPVILLLAAAWFPARAAEDAIKLAARGVKAYEAAHYALAESFFERALLDARLKGQAAFASMATANLVDVRLEMGRPKKAEEALVQLGPPPRDTRSLIHWKTAQVALALGQAARARAEIDSAMAAKPETAWITRLQLDRYRSLWLSGDTAGLSESLRASLPGRGQSMRPGYLALLAEVAMKDGRYAEADDFLAEAISGYREAKRYARATTLLWKRAACASSLGQKAAALQYLREALSIAAEVGLDPQGLEQVLSGMLGQDPGANIAKRLQGSDFGEADARRPSGGLTGPGTHDELELDRDNPNGQTLESRGEISVQPAPAHPLSR